LQTSRLLFQLTDFLCLPLHYHYLPGDRSLGFIEFPFEIPAFLRLVLPAPPENLNNHSQG
jgi:hypothetical protein